MATEGDHTSDAAEPETQPESSIASLSQSNSPLPLADYQDYIREYPFAAEPTYFTRPNRYYGPASTWRSWTADERAIAESLDATRASDLGIHLINAFTLKQHHGYLSNYMQVSPEPGRLTEREEPTDDRAYAESSFRLPNTWTAWPLPAEKVPRSSFREAINDQHSGVQVRARPSAALEDALIATTLKYAKVRFGRRDSAPAQPRTKREKRDWQAERDTTKRHLVSLGLVRDDVGGPEIMSGAADNQNMIDAAVEHVETDDESLAESDIPEGVQTFSSQAFVANSSSSSEAEEVESDSEEDKPVFSADDDHARRIMLPSVRHTLTKLDDLLTGLHKARQAYATKHSTSRSQSRHTFSEAETTDDDSFIRSGSRTAIRKRERSRKRSLSKTRIPKSSEVSLSRSTSKSRRSSDSRQNGQRNKEHGLRDWSDVIGMAALTGWDTAVVARASERCAKMFDQNMMFRTFHELPPKRTGSHGNKAIFEEEYAYVSPAEHSPAPSTRRDVPEAVPFAVDERNFDVESPASYTSGDSGSFAALGISVDMSALSCPIVSCDQRSYIYKRPTRLYDHIRYVHPDFDLDSFKKLVARTSRRGKYKRRRVGNEALTLSGEVGHVGAEND